MTTETPHDTIKALDALLENEREALLQGDLDRLVSLLERKRVLVEALNADPGEAGEQLEPLRGKVARNQALLDSALQGIRSVATRMGTLHRIRQSLDTYDETGRKTTIEALRVPGMEKRA